MIRTVKALVFLGGAPAGGSQSFFVKADDGIQYLVKTQGNPQGIQTLINEVIAAQIAILIEVPTTEPVLVEIDAAFQQSAGLQPETVGLNFGSKRVIGVISGATRHLIEHVDNIDKFAPVITSDAATENIDRDNGGNFLIVSINGSSLEFVAIDFGHCFGHTWDETIEALCTWCGNVLPETCLFIRGTSPFDLAIQASRRITTIQIDSIVDSVPGTWGLSVTKAAALKKFLGARLQTVDNLLYDHKHLFPHWI